MAVMPLRLRWAMRNLRARWLQVAGIALMIAIGTGLASGLTSSTQWRAASNEASFELTNMYELRARLGGDTRLPRGALIAVASTIDGIKDAEERLIFESQIEVNTPKDAVVVPSRIIGVDMSDGGPHVNGIITAVGRDIEPYEFGTPVVLLERNFGIFYDVADQGELRLGDGTTVRYAGHAMSPEYFLVVEDGNIFAQSHLAILFTSLETAQELSSSQDMINDLILTLKPGADLKRVEESIVAEIARRYPETAINASTRADDAAYVALTGDIEGDQAVYNVISLVLFGGAAFAALNFAARIVETQRREIGISMALGLNPVSIATRPILLGVQIAILGVVFGLIMGWIVSRMMAGVLEDFLVLPVFLTPFETEVFIVAAAIGVLVPLVAVLWPVYRAIRVQPVEAIQTGHLASRGGGLAPLVARIPMPRGSVIRMPFRNILRAPRRTILTTLALSTVLAILFATVGMRDSFITSLRGGSQELLGDNDDRLIVKLDAVHETDSEVVSNIIASGALRSTEPVLTIAAAIGSNKGIENQGHLFNDLASAESEVLRSVDEDAVLVSVQMLDFESEVWTPIARVGKLELGVPGIVLARKAASDIGVNIGDELVLSHPRAVDAGIFTVDSTPLRVLAIHGHPLRSIAYIDRQQAELIGLAGLVNGVTAIPADGLNLIDAKRELFDVQGVATVQGLAEGFKAIADLFEQFAAVFLIIEIVILGLSLLIAINTANINVEERSRDHATMFAYGMSVRRVVSNLVIEGLVVGAFATLIGIALGSVLLLWIIHSLVPASYPELGIAFTVDLAQLALLLIAAISLIAIAPIFSVRKLQRMDIPSTLRVME